MPGFRVDESPEITLQMWQMLFSWFGRTDPQFPYLVAVLVAFKRVEERSTESGGTEPRSAEALSLAREMLFPDAKERASSAAKRRVDQAVRKLTNKGFITVDGESYVVGDPGEILPASTVKTLNVNDLISEYTSCWYESYREYPYLNAGKVRGLLKKLVDSGVAPDDIVDRIRWCFGNRALLRAKLDISAPSIEAIVGFWNSISDLKQDADGEESSFGEYRQPTGQGGQPF